MREYQKEDYSLICKWCAERDISPPPEWSLPEHGLIVDGHAVGFLILMNNRCGILDFYISSPFSDKIFRSRALDKITRGLLDIAKEQDLKIVLASTKKMSVKDRAIRNGFSPDGHFMSLKKEI